MEARTTSSQHASEIAVKGTCKYTVQIATESGAVKSYRDVVKDLLLRQIQNRKNA